MSAKRADRKGQRRLDTEERTEYWRGLSLAEQVSSLDRRLGEGVGAVRQRARLQARIEEQARVKKAAKKTKS